MHLYLISATFICIFFLLLTYRNIRTLKTWSYIPDTITGPGKGAEWKGRFVKCHPVIYKEIKKVDP